MTTARRIRSANLEVATVADGAATLDWMSSSVNAIVIDQTEPQADGMVLSGKLSMRGSKPAAVVVSEHHTPGHSKSLPFPSTVLTTPLSTSTLVATIEPLTA